MKYLLIVLVLLSWSCGHLPPTAHPVDPADRTACPAACEHLRALGCEEGKPLGDGTTCEQFCEQTQAAGHALRPVCVSAITSCSELGKCALPR